MSRHHLPSDGKELSLAMNDSGEKPLTLGELRALAEKQDRLNGLAYEAKAQTHQNKEVSGEDLLSLGEKKAGAEIVFGPEGETQLIFRPSTGRFKGAARWTVSLKGNISRYDTQRELNIETIKRREKSRVLKALKLGRLVRYRLADVEAVEAEAEVTR
jgi:hypothetical protein